MTTRPIVSLFALATVGLALGAADPDEDPRFTEITARSGIDFRFVSGTRGKHDLPEIMAGGLALFDADGDGHLDLYLCQGGPIARDSREADSPSRFYSGRGDGTFQDITRQAGMPGPRYAMGTAVGDVDGDGRDDLLVTGWGGLALYRNQGGNRFEDITARAGLVSRAWSTSAAFADLDADGDLDLYVATYLEYDPDAAPYCAAPDGKRDYCGPEVFPAQLDLLFRNDGGGRFTEVGAAAGIALAGGRGLGVLIADLVGDPRPDVPVANDGTPSWLFENRGDLRFREVAAEAGVATDGAGEAMAAMGLALGDLDADGREDLAITNYLDRGTVAFRSLGQGRYQDASAALGLTAATRPVLGFGVALEDLDADADLDLVQANGHVLDRERLGVPLRMRPTLLGNAGGRFTPREGGLGGAALGRGLAVGDLDGDARPDLVIATLDGPPRLLRNASEGRFAEIRLEPQTQAVGARVRVRVGETWRERQAVSGGSYLTGVRPGTTFFGPGETGVIQEIEVRWPDGSISRRTGPLPAGRILVRHSGRG